jgi:hypothetical protein
MVHRLVASDRSAGHRGRRSRRKTGRRRISSSRTHSVVRKVVGPERDGTRDGAVIDSAHGDSAAVIQPHLALTPSGGTERSLSGFRTTVARGIRSSPAVPLR